MATPGLHDYGALLDALRGVRWNARLRPRTTNIGAHTAKRIGPNVEVTEYRPYPVDDSTLQVLQDNLVKYNPDPATLAGILSALQP